jgi:hypothetical protein
MGSSSSKDEENRHNDKEGRGGRRFGNSRSVHASSLNHISQEPIVTQKEFAWE